MLLAGGLTAALGIISLLLGISTVLVGGPLPGLNVNFTWTFWMAVSAILLLMSIAFLLARNQKS